MPSPTHLLAAHQFPHPSTPRILCHLGATRAVTDCRNCGSLSQELVTCHHIHSDRHLAGRDSLPIRNLFGRFFEVRRGGGGRGGGSEVLIYDEMEEARVQSGVLGKRGGRRGKESDFKSGGIAWRCHVSDRREAALTGVLREEEFAPDMDLDSVK